ncbi:Hercynine oxygenase [Pontiella desulfatans]|uniref:Hercynine oxygenase n=1 Tax=Pontiella desulfatans TaxID=2750659 RepID=A0A6C2U7J8_PONDE|nr:5-histidylcysteine sulfoxide synthase [Pontiella desulfatans]VGO16068.1 Hercynine oxygenase [Pontiella desulfatans]
MEFITQNIDLASGDAEAKRAGIKGYFNATWKLYERLFDTLASDEVFYNRPQPLRHPLIFYFGHTAVFFVNKLMLAKLIDRRVDARMESVFAIGVDEMSWDDLNEDHYDWPSVAETRAYRNQVQVVVNELIDTVDFSMPIDWESPLWPVVMGIEHERIHLETSSVLIRQLDLASVKPSPLFPVCPDVGDAPENRLLDVPGGAVELGKGKGHHLYGWDNEYGKASFGVTDFQASKYLVSNREFLSFMEDGGYADDRWWDAEGRAWRNYHQAAMPEFWRGEPGAFRLRLMTEEIPLPPNWPAEVCYLEAKAFCNWKGEQTGQAIRMPDEAEYRRMLQVAGLEAEHHESPVAANWNLEHYASSVPVDTFAHGDFFDLVGNVWQWNETPIYGFDGFEVHPLYDDFSVPTFDNRHNLIKGGSWISTGNEIALHSRYAFRRHFYQHAGFRYVASERMVKKEFDVYETDALISQYCEFHYGEPCFGVPNFPQTMALLALDAMDGRKKGRALDIGCSVGRCAFELADAFDAVDALDFSARFVQVGARLQRSGRIRYERIEEGDLVSLHEHSLKELGLHGEYSNINFMQQDATNMKSEFSGYDLVVAANLIDRLNDPARFLRDIRTRMNPGGVLLIASPYTWLEEFTKKEKWLGGFKRDGEPVTTLDGLHAELDAGFALQGSPLRVPFVIRETKNKHQHTLSEVTVWIRK